MPKKKRKDDEPLAMGIFYHPSNTEVATPPKPYPEERRDMVLAEINRELAEDSPNWYYLERLKAEFEYWRDRAKNSKSTSFINILSGFWGSSDDDE